MTDDYKILVIDDSDDDRDLYRRCLAKAVDMRSEVHEAADGEKGLELAQSLQPDCILLDYSLPGRNGVEVLKRIRAKNPFVPVVILTGQGNEAVAVAAMKEGAQDYIAKSTITPEALERVVRVAIAHGNMQRRIHEQRTSLEIFTYALAHDLREPTNTVRSFSELILKREQLSEKGLGYFNHVLKASQRMQDLIDAVYTYTRLDGREVMEKENIPLGDLFKEVEENLSQLIQGKKVAINTGVLPEVTANRTQLAQLLQNLVANAIHHGGDEVTIEVGASERDDDWLIWVADSGPGIESQYVERIFEPFKRFSTGPNRGLGLGLAIARKIAEFQGGKIWVESIPGKGATFFFTLPKAIAKPIASSKPTAATTAARANGHEGTNLARILLVDDNEADLALNRIMLIEQTRMQCDILTANDGRQALDMLQEAKQQGNPIDVVLLDINMPVMSGFELLAQLHIDDTLKGTLVVMCSTSAYDIDKRMALSMGAAGYLTKPPQFPQFRAIVESNPQLELRQQGESLTLCRAAA